MFRGFWPYGPPRKACCSKIVCLRFVSVFAKVSTQRQQQFVFGRSFLWCLLLWCTLDRKRFGILRLGGFGAKKKSWRRDQWRFDCTIQRNRAQGQMENWPRHLIRDLCCGLLLGASGKNGFWFGSVFMGGLQLYIIWFSADMCFCGDVWHYFRLFSKGQINI